MTQLKDKSYMQKVKNVNDNKIHFNGNRSTTGIS